MAKVLRIGLLGASKIARGAVIAPVRDDPDFVVAAVAARDPDRARAYAAEHGIPEVAENYAALIARDDLDLIYNALPPAGHAAWTIATLESGKAVLCEKPFARNAEEAGAMVAAAEATGQVLLEAFHYRYHNVMRRAEAILREKPLGAIKSAKAVFHAPIAKAPGELRWLADQGGGSLMDLGCYPMHALRTLLGVEPEVLQAKGVFEDGVDSAMAAQLSFPGEIEGLIASSMIEPEPSAWLKLEGEHGSLEIINFLAPQMGCRFTTTIDGQTQVHPTSGLSTYAAQMRHVHDVLVGGVRPLTGGDDAVCNMLAIDAIYAAARKIAAEEPA